MIYALDTNSVSYFIQGHSRVSALLRKVLADGHFLIIPPITYYEIRRGFLRKSAPAKERVFERICTMYPIGEMNIAVWEYAARLYAELSRAGQMIEDADILIAAFCIVGGYTLVTHNTRHFKDSNNSLMVQSRTVQSLFIVSRLTTFERSCQRSDNVFGRISVNADKPLSLNFFLPIISAKWILITAK